VSGSSQRGRKKSIFAKEEEESVWGKFERYFEQHVYLDASHGDASSF